MVTDAMVKKQEQHFLAVLSTPGEVPHEVQTSPSTRNLEIPEQLPVITSMEQDAHFEKQDERTHMQGCPERGSMRHDSGTITRHTASPAAHRMNTLAMKILVEVLKSPEWNKVKKRLRELNAHRES